jgi:hypothetical protein
LVVEDEGVRSMVVVGRVVLALFAGFAGLVGLATAARPEPVPCRDTVVIVVEASAMCVAPNADTRLVLTGAVAAGAIAWLGSGHLQRRFLRF